MPDQTPQPSADALRRGRVLYVRTAVPLETIAALMGLSRNALSRRIERWGWPARPRLPADRAGRPRPARVARPLRRAGEEGRSRRETGRALEDFIAGRLRAHEAEAAAGQDPDPERTARAVTQLARGLTLIRSYLADLDEEQVDDDAGPPARSLSELRDELRGHLQRIRLEGGAGRGAPAAPAEPERD